MFEHASTSRLVAAALCAAAIGCFAAPASAQDASFGVRVGGSWNALPQPNDPEGEPTLMSGTAFSGLGFQGGFWAGFPLAELDGGELRLEAGAMYGRLRGSGFEQRGDARREAVIHTNVIRLPVLAVYAASSTGSTSRIGLGVEPLFGFSSGATVTIENSDEAVEPLYTTPVTHLGLTALLGYDFAVDDGIAIPLELRVTYDPMVGSSTLDRFQDYSRPSNPGDYEAAFTWQFLLTTGVSFDI
ncbi:MAG: hypothetical protein ACQEVA_22710 [Myxococcota bacterium]